MKYYIVNQQALGKDPISNFKLYTSEKMNEDRDFVIEVNVPDDYSVIQEDDHVKIQEYISLNELGYTILVRRNKKWVEWNNLKPFKPHEFDAEMAKQGYHQVPHIGYLNSEEFRKWFRNLHPELFEKKKKVWNTAYYS